MDYTNEFKPVDFFSDYKTALYKWLSTKSKCWNYEEEVRVTFRDFPFKNGENSKLININKQSIKKIFFGSKIDPEHQKIILNNLKEINSKIEFYQMERKSNSFDLIPKKISQ